MTCAWRWATQVASFRQLAVAGRGHEDHLVLVTTRVTGASLPVSS